MKYEVELKGWKAALIVAFFFIGVGVFLSGVAKLLDSLFVLKIIS